MRKQDGVSIIALIIIITILLIIAGVIANKLIGKDGVLSQYKEADNEYNKYEVVEKLNSILKEKYVLDHKYASENNKKFEEIHTEQIVFEYLVENGYIEELKDIKDNLVQDQYYINTEKLNGDIVTTEINPNGSNGNGTKVFKIKKQDDKYLIFFVDKYGFEEQIGELNMNPEV